MNRRRKLTSLGLAALVLAAAAACDTSWEDMTAWSWGTRCDRPIQVATHTGDFTPGQHADVTSALTQWRDAGALPIVYTGDTDLRAETNTVDNLVIVEKRPVVDPSGTPHTGYGWPGIDPVTRQTPYRGRAWISPSVDYLRSPSAVGFDSGATWQGLVLHELGHALLGLGDRYDNDDGHPLLIMGNGPWHFNQLAAGDLRGANLKGCRAPAEKQRIDQELSQL